MPRHSETFIPENSLPNGVRKCQVCTAFKSETLFVKTHGWHRWRCKDCDNAELRSEGFKLRIQALEALGGRCNWPGCSWADPMALCVDHIEGNGNTERRKGQNRLTLYRKIIKSTVGYQVLCENHNRIKERTIDSIRRKNSEVN